MLTTTWASRPAAASNAGQLLTVSDIGVGGGSLWFSDGTYWVPAAPITIARSGVKISIPNNTLLTEQAYVTVPIPAGTMGLKGAVFADALWTITGSTNAKTMRIRFGGIAGSTISTAANSTASNLTARTGGQIRNSDVTHQVFAPAALIGGPSTGTGSSVQRPTFDTALAWDITITGQLALVGEAIDLEWYEVRLLP